jgi:hypothetical protein
MPRYLDRDDWPEHPILSRLVGRSDLDSDGTFQLRDYDPQEFEACVTIYIEGSNDGGQTWRSCEFSDRISYVDEIGAGWSWPFALKGVYFRSEQLIWRAVLPE